jgi:hypothetical protein
MRKLLLDAVSKPPARRYDMVLAACQEYELAGRRELEGSLEIQDREGVSSALVTLGWLWLVRARLRVRPSLWFEPWLGCAYLVVAGRDDEELRGAVAIARSVPTQAAFREDADLRLLLAMFLEVAPVTAEPTAVGERLHVALRSNDGDEVRRVSALLLERTRRHPRRPSSSSFRLVPIELLLARRYFESHQGRFPKLDTDPVWRAWEHWQPSAGVQCDELSRLLDLSAGLDDTVKALRSSKDKSRARERAVATALGAASEIVGALRKEGSPTRQRPAAGRKATPK